VVRPVTFAAVVPILCIAGVIFAVGLPITASVWKQLTIQAIQAKTGVTANTTQVTQGAPQ